MGITIGDALAAVGGLLGICASIWALVVGCSLLFGQAAERAEREIEHPWRSFGVGLLVALTLGVVSFALVASPVPLLKLLGTVLYVVLLFVASVGGAGVAGTAARRIREMDPDLSPFAALVRGAGILVLSGILPVLGWFGIAPIALLVALGAGTLATLKRAAPVRAESAEMWQ
ncbi:MAG: hypothetical protein M9921_15475 [Fimbriimonadaceae bacterium]|nr:hypothetical protein [Chthonomonadaceae bacterium]MCO5298248.1 hypothetical protein [Fimbriimonadaceae bacterium]